MKSSFFIDWDTSVGQPMLRHPNECHTKANNQYCVFVTSTSNDFQNKLPLRISATLSRSDSVVPQHIRIVL